MISNITSLVKQVKDISVFRGAPYQRGYGLGSLFKRFGIPILQFLGKRLVKTGVNIGNDYLAGRNFVPAIKDNARQGIRKVASEGLDELKKLVDQSGSGIRKRVTHKSKKRKKVSNDIFS